MPQTAAYGTWRSPITAEMIVKGTVGLGGTCASGDDLYWLEMRPGEGGRYVIVRQDPAGDRIDCNPAPSNARTRVHEYGGGSFAVVGEAVYFTEFGDQRLYVTRGSGSPSAVTDEAPVRYADFTWDAERSRLICVREDHRGDREAVNSLVAIAPEAGGVGELLVDGRDFFAAPRVSPDGGHLAFLAWDHPKMPWDAAELWLAPIDADGSLGEARRIAGGEGESVVLPAWSPDGRLHFVCDRTNWWNLYRLVGDEVEAVCPMEAEFARPLWRLGLKMYDFLSPEEIVCTYEQGGMGHLAVLGTQSGELRELATPYTVFSGITVLGRKILCVAGGPEVDSAVVEIDTDSGAVRTIRTGGTIDLDRDLLSVPEPVEFPTADDATAHGLFYRPQNPDFVAPEGEKPPCVVMIHGGPTAATTSARRLDIQYYTSRGLAVLDVNYRGSTGYGREYREALYGRWGVADVDDCCRGAQYLAEQGLVDGERLAITGGSAGGYTTLAALAFRDAFAAGASHFGVSDCEALAQETHKFESRYLDTILGPYPEQRDLYVERSPIHHLDGFDRPVVFFQGLEDEIVPANQAETMYEALKARGVATAYVPFEGEQHGFRKAGNIQRAMEWELLFFGRVLGFDPADEIPPLAIDNL